MAATFQTRKKRGQRGIFSQFSHFDSPDLERHSILRSKIMKLYKQKILKMLKPKSKEY